MLRCLLLILLLSASWLSTASAATPRVLLLNSYHPQYAWTADLTRGVQDALTGVIADEDLYIEFLDGRRMVDDPAYFNDLHQLYAVKYAQFHPDVVMTSDDYAFQFMLAEGDQLFPGVPVVFCGINVFDPDMLKGHDNYTGLLEGMEVAGNLDLILRLQPDVQHIVMLADQTSFGQRMVQHARAILQARETLRWAPNVQVEIWDDVAIDELHKKLYALKPHSAVLMLAIHKDRDGRYFSFARDLPTLTADSNAPVYGMWGALMLGHGVIGGMMNNPYQHGQAAAQMVKQLLSGSSIHAIPIQQKAEYKPYFDYRVLQRFHIDTARLPEGSSIEFEPQTFYQKNRELLIQSVILVSALSLTIVVLLFYIVHRRRYARELRTLNTELEHRVHDRTLELEIKNRMLAAMNESMSQLAYTDMLTELPNRRAGQDLLQHLLDRAEQDGSEMSLAILDIDHFKSVNDQHGHDVGDAVLRHVAQHAQHSLRPLDRIFRWGGEEFLLLLPGANSSAAVRVCDRIRSQIACEAYNRAGIVTVSIGVAAYEKGEALHHWVKRADEAMYAAKRRGRDCVVAADAAS